MFSSMSMSRETGDVGGTEIFLFGLEPTYALILNAEGQLHAPQIVRVELSGQNVKFSAEFRGRALSFQGSVSATHLTGKFSDGSSLRLPRKKPLMLTTYSDLTLSRQTGDAVGMEIISFIADRSYVLILKGQGDFAPPELVPASTENGGLQFKMRSPFGGVETFRGKESKSFLSGSFIETKDPVKLPARKSFWE